MTGKLWLFLGLAAASAAPAASQSTSEPPAASAKNWSSLARQDVQAAYDIYVANHPGIHDPLNPNFPEKLKRARDAGLGIAANAETQGDYAEALGAFSAELMDGHAQAFAKQAPSTTATRFEWPSFIAAWRGDRMVVQHAVAGTPAPIGVRIVACDGLAVRDLVTKRLAYRGFRPAETGHWWLRGGQAFYSTPMFRANRPEQCTFRTSAGQEFNAPLTYTPAPENFTKLLERATDGERTPIALTEPRAGIFLIGMQTFQPGPDEVKAYRALFETITRRRGELLNARSVVIDLRFNNGGSSSWSGEAARALWGKQAFEARIEDYFKDIEIWWRASAGNVAYMADLEAQVRKNGHARFADSIKKVSARMKSALAKGELFHVEADEEKGPPTAALSGKLFPDSDFKTRVYVITSGRCASACLDALDAFKRFSNVKLIGAPTSGDSTYMEVRSMDLPSGEGRIVIPNKIWMKRPRGSGEIYTPDIEMTGIDWSTTAFLDRIQADLNR